MGAAGAPEFAGAKLGAAAGVRDCAGVGLQLAFERTEGTGGSYEAAGAHRAIYARRRCSGARSSPAMADGGFGRSWGSGYRARARERGEGKRRQAHRDAAGWLSGLGDAPEPTNLTKMAGGSEVEDEPGEVVRGLLEGRGSVRWVEDGVAELVG